MSQFEARNVHINFPCRNITVLKCGKAITRVPYTTTVCNFAGSRLTPYTTTHTNCTLNTVPWTPGCNGTRIDPTCGVSDLPIDWGQLTPEDIGPLRQILEAHKAEIDQHIADLDRVNEELG